MATCNAELAMDVSASQPQPQQHTAATRAGVITAATRATVGSLRAAALVKPHEQREQRLAQRWEQLAAQFEAEALLDALGVAQRCT